uniref:Uncharacterized protein n=1 Tax=Salix viminalis TaxID=40686 RepID=A0A6N2LT80_SALVM
MKCLEKLLARVQNIDARRFEQKDTVSASLFKYSIDSTSSAPFTVKQEATGITPRGLHTRVTVESLNQKSFPCFKMNHRRLHVLMCSPCFINHPVLSGFDQNSTPSVWVDWVCVRANAARQRDAMESARGVGGWI